MSKIITTHLLLDATVDRVWQTLTDLAGYRQWNPFITAAAGTIKVGERLDLTIQPPGSRAMAFTPWVTAVEQHHYIEWLGRLRSQASSTVDTASPSPPGPVAAPCCNSRRRSPVP